MDAIVHQTEVLELSHRKSLHPTSHAEFAYSDKFICSRHFEEFQELKIIEQMVPNIPFLCSHLEEYPSKSDILLFDFRTLVH